MRQKDYLYTHCLELEKTNAALRSENADLKMQCAEAKDDYTELETENETLKVANARLHEELNARTEPTAELACMRETNTNVRLILQHLTREK